MQKDIIQQIREGVIDINNQELFFSNVIKGLILDLNKDISVRNIKVPHFILHTGNDAMYLEIKGYDNSIEPTQISNENYIYSITPRCIINPAGIDLIPDQLTNPYSLGKLQYDSGEELYDLTAEFRRIPIKMEVELKYITDTFRDMLEIIQQVITKLSFLRTYSITYMGQHIKCSYQLPQSFSEDHLMDLDGTTTDNKSHTMELSIEIESHIPVYNEKTIMSSGDVISKYSLGDKILGKRYGDNPFYNKTESELYNSENGGSGNGNNGGSGSGNNGNNGGFEDYKDYYGSIDNGYNSTRKHGLIIKKTLTGEIDEIV